MVSSLLDRARDVILEESIIFIRNCWFFFCSSVVLAP